MISERTIYNITPWYYRAFVQQWHTSGVLFETHFVINGYASIL